MESVNVSSSLVVAELPDLLRLIHFALTVFYHQLNINSLECVWKKCFYAIIGLFRCRQLDPDDGENY